MSGRGGKSRGTVDPALIVDADSWLESYKKKYANIVLGEDGTMRVLDVRGVKENFAEALANPVKVIPHKKEDDYIAVLRDSRTSEELRAAALAKRDEVVQRTTVASAAEIPAYLNTERTLLAAVDAWKGATTVAMRTAAALEVARLTKELGQSERSIRFKQYPYRYLFDDEKTRKEIDYTSIDTSTARRKIVRYIPETTEPADRGVVLIAAGKA